MTKNVGQVWSLIILLLWGHFASAQVTLAIGYNSRFERASNDQEFAETRAPSFGVGYRWNHWQMHVEYQTHYSEAYNSPLGLERRYEELVLWGRYVPQFFERWSPYIALGVGAYRDRVKALFRDQSFSEQGQPEWLWGGGLGFEWQIFNDWYAELETRMAYPLVERKLDFSWGIAIRYSL